MVKKQNREFKIEEQLAPTKLREICSSCNKPRITASLSDWIFGARDYDAMLHRWGCTCDSGPDATAQIEFGNKYPVDPLINSVVRNWRIESLAETDYLGNIYKAIDTTTGAKVAIRIFNIVLSQNPRIVKRFLQEAEKSSQLTHSNIGMVYESGRLPDGNAFVVSEWVAGTRLSKKLQTEGFYSTRDAVMMFTQICDALEEAHQHEILHRGIKPENILIHDGNKVKVVEFGLEKAIPPAGKATQCLSKITGELGDPRYMSPEQCLGQPVDERSDIYSLGCVMYEVLTGKKIYGRFRGINAALAQLQLEPDRFDDVMYNHDLPKALEQVVFQCLEKMPENRYQKVGQLRSDLMSLVNNGTPSYLRQETEKKKSDKMVQPVIDFTKPMIVGLIFLSVLLPGLALVLKPIDAPVKTKKVRRVIHEEHVSSPYSGTPGKRVQFVSKPLTDVHLDMGEQPSTGITEEPPTSSTEEPPIPTDPGNTKLFEQELEAAMLGNWRYRWDKKSGDMLITNTWGRRFAGFLVSGKEVVGVSGRISVTDDRVFLLQTDGQGIYNGSNLVKRQGKWQIIAPYKTAKYQGFEAKKVGSVSPRLWGYKPTTWTLQGLDGKWMPLNKNDDAIKTFFEVKQVSDKGVFRISRDNGKRGFIVIDNKKRVVFEHNFEWELSTLKEVGGVPTIKGKYALANYPDQFKSVQDNPWSWNAP